MNVDFTVCEITTKTISPDTSMSPGLRVRRDTVCY